MIFKELSNFSVKYNKKDINMNLHEECLLKYLLNPMDLFRSTEMLKLNNSLIEKDLANGNNLLKSSKIKYRTTRV